LALTVPGDGVVNPTDVVQAYTKGATKNSKSFLSCLLLICMKTVKNGEK